MTDSYTGNRCHINISLAATDASSRRIASQNVKSVKVFFFFFFGFAAQAMKENIKCGTLFQLDMSVERIC